MQKKYILNRNLRHLPFRIHESNFIKSIFNQSFDTTYCVDENDNTTILKEEKQTTQKLHEVLTWFNQSYLPSEMRKHFIIWYKILLGLFVFPLSTMNPFTLLGVSYSSLHLHLVNPLAPLVRPSSHLYPISLITFYHLEYL